MAEETPSQKSNPVIFSLIIPWEKVKQEYQKILAGAVAKAEIDGFRPGKAPLNLIEEKIGKSRIYQDVIDAVVPPAYRQEVEKRGLRPIIAPRLKPVKLEESRDWEFEVAVVELPKVDLGEWEANISKELAPLKLVADVKSEPTEADKKAREAKRLQVAFDTLLKSVKVELPQMLVDEEVNIQLSKLVDQVKAVGMTIDQYLSAKQFTAEKLRADYEKTAKDALSLNLALDAVAKAKNFTDKDRVGKAVEYLTNL
jgi:FKBP-type peptidyl-prolyl cis-trans isomerase (trigger factor)